MNSHLSRVETEFLKYFNYLTHFFFLQSFTFYIGSVHLVTKTEKHERWDSFSILQTVWLNGKMNDQNNSIPTF